jgi:hypothetical protein
MMEKYNLENYYQLSISKVVSKIIDDLNKIEGFELMNPKPWKSNLPNILPFIGNVMEEEIKFKIKGYEILAQDQKLRNQK